MLGKPYVVELLNVEMWERCELNTKTGEKIIDKEHKVIPYFTGLFFRDENTFFGLYPTERGPIMYYEGKEYPVTKDLHIIVEKKGDRREFHIEEYDIHIQYRKSKFIGFDSWSTEIDVDLFYQIAQSYKTEEFYEKYTNC